MSMCSEREIFPIQRQRFLTPMNRDRHEGGPDGKMTIFSFWAGLIFSVFSFLFPKTYYLKPLKKTICAQVIYVPF